MWMMFLPVHQNVAQCIIERGDLNDLWMCHLAQQTKVHREDENIILEIII